MMLTHRPAYYRPLDPLHNFKIKVTVKKVRPGDLSNKKNKGKKKNKKAEDEEDSNIARDPFLNKSWSFSFEWQEKKFSPREIFTLEPESSGILAKKRNQIEIGYHKQLMRLKDNGVDITPQPGVVISSKVDKDGFIPKEEKAAITTSDTATRTEIGDAVVSFSARTGNQTVSTAKTRLKRETSLTVMQIIATVDVESEDLVKTKGSKLRKQLKDLQKKEIVLCQIKLNDKNGLLEMKPPFAFEPYGSGRDLSNTNSDKSKEQRARGTYQFRSPKGAIYEYTLENAAPVKDELMAEDIDLMERKEDKEKIEAYRNQTGSRFARTVEEESDVCMAAMCEIVSATKFDGEQLYIQWKVLLPPVGWTWSPELTKNEIATLSSGSTQICTASYNSTGKTPLTSLIHPTANFSFPLEFHFVSSNGDDPLKAHNLPRIYFEVGSAGSWGRHYIEGYGFVTIPRQAGSYERIINTWKPHGTIRQRMDDFFLGGSRHLSNHVNYVGLLKPLEQGPFLNKYGFSTESSGSIRIRMNVILHHQERTPPTASGGKLDEHGNLIPVAGPTSNLTEVRKSRGVNDILGTLKLSRKSTLSEVMGRAKAGTGTSGALSSIYSKLRSSRDPRTYAERSRAGNLSPTRSAMGSPIRGFPGTPQGSFSATPKKIRKKGSALLARLKKSSSKNITGDKGGD